MKLRTIIILTPSPCFKAALGSDELLKRVFEDYASKLYCEEDEVIPSTDNCIEFIGDRDIEDVMSQAFDIGSEFVASNTTLKEEMYNSLGVRLADIFRYNLHVGYNRDAVLTIGIGESPPQISLPTKDL